MKQNFGNIGNRKYTSDSGLLMAFRESAGKSTESIRGEWRCGWIIGKANGKSGHGENLSDASQDFGRGIPVLEGFPV